MTCDQIERDDIAEQYVLGRLSENARARFEAHYFDCSGCLDRVEHLESVRSALAHTRPGTAGTTGWRTWRWRGAAGVAVAATIVLVVLTPRESATPTADPPSASRDIGLPATARGIDVDRLGAIEPPPFTPTRLRSSDATASRRAFFAAMEGYGRGDYAGAIDGLEDATRADPASPAAHFFLAVCYLQLGRTQEAAEHLRQVTQLGESPYLEDAHFFLAKASIRSGDLDAARSHLQVVVALDGDRRDDALRLMAELP